MITKNPKSAVEIVPYDSRAPEIFESVKKFIANIISYEVEIEHVGSTAVTGLGGKGIIDILIITKRRQQLVEIADILRNNGFSHNPESKHAEDRFFVSGSYRYEGTDLHIHIHITFQNSGAHKDMVAFRDYLRLHPEEAEAYYELKKEWGKEAGSDAGKYTELKTTYINKVHEKARKEIGDDM
ncbi:MAG: GrpB family protein [Candidatus Bathyarchaeia archaeon]